MNNNNLPTKTESLSNTNIVEKINKSLKESCEDIKKISNISTDIYEEGFWSSFWNKSENIRILAKNFILTSKVLQSSFDLNMLILGAAGRMKSDYNSIISTIESLTESYQNNTKVLEYLAKIKNNIDEMVNNDTSVKNKFKIYNFLIGLIFVINIIMIIFFFLKY